MADIQVRIKLNDGVSGEQIDSVAFNQETNNVSKAIGSKTTKNNGQNLISWGEDGLAPIIDGYVGGANATLSSQGGYNGFVFGVVPKSKSYSVEVTLEGEGIDSVTFYGDKTANQFPTRAIFNGEYIYSDDAEWTIVFPNSSATQIITFDMWNRGNYNACFTHIGVFVNELVLDKRWIKSIQSLSQSTGRPKEIYYGVVPNRGNIEIIDINGEIEDYIKDGIITNENLPIRIYIDEKQQQVHLSTDSNYTNDKIFSIQNSNILQSWNDFKISPEVTSSTPSNLSDYFQTKMREFGFNQPYINRMLGSDYSGYGFRAVRDGKNAKQIMELIKIPYQYHKCNTLMEFINEICKVCQFCVMCDNYNYPIFVNGNPSFESDTIIKIPSSIMFGIPEKDILLKNKFQNVKYIENNLIKNIKDVCNKTFYYRDGLGNIDWDNISSIFGEARIIDDRVLGVFIECSDSGSEFIWDTSNSEDGIMHPVVITYQKDGRTTSTGMVVGTFPELYATKEDYTFTSGVAELVKYRTLNSKVFAPAFSLSEMQDADSVSISIMQQCISKVQNEKLLNSETNNIYEMPDGNFLSAQTLYESSDNIYIHNGCEILKNYNNGVSVANISISCTDLYDINGNKVLDYSNGEIIEVGDIVRVDKDNNANSLWSYKDGTPMYWKVTGRNFRKVGVPMIDLELQEVRGDFTHYTISFPESVSVYVGDVQLTSGAVVLKGTNLNIIYRESEHYHMTEFKINGVDAKNNSKISVDSDVNITFVEKPNLYSINFTDNVYVLKGTQELQSGDKIEYGTKLTFGYRLQEGYLLDSFSINGVVSENNSTVTVNGDIYATLTTISKILAENTFAQISKISAKISSQGMTSDEVARTYGWKIGDKKPFNLTTGEQIEAKITGINHDDKANSIGKAGITFDMANCLHTLYSIYDTSSSAGGYPSSVFRNTTISIIESTLPQELRDVIVPVKKKSANGGKVSYTETITTNERLFILSAIEVFGYSTNSSGGTCIDYVQAGETEGHQYEYYKNNPQASSRIKRRDVDGDGYFYGNVDVDVAWALRSCISETIYINGNPVTRESFRLVSAMGECSGVPSSVESSVPVSVAFCI